MLDLKKLFSMPTTTDSVSRSTRLDSDGPDIQSATPSRPQSRSKKGRLVKIDDQDLRIRSMRNVSKLIPTSEKQEDSVDIDAFDLKSDTNGLREKLCYSPDNMSPREILFEAKQRATMRVNGLSVSRDKEMTSR